MGPGCSYTCAGKKRPILQEIICVTPDQLAAIQRDVAVCRAERDSFQGSAQEESTKAADALTVVKEQRGEIDRLEKLIVEKDLLLSARNLSIATLKRDVWLTGFVSGFIGGVAGAATAGATVYDKYK